MGYVVLGAIRYHFGVRLVFGMWELVDYFLKYKGYLLGAGLLVM